MKDQNGSINRKKQLQKQLDEMSPQEYEAIKQEMQRSFDEVVPGVQAVLNDFLDDNPEIKSRTMKRIREAVSQKA